MDIKTISAQDKIIVDRALNQGIIQHSEIDFISQEVLMVLRILARIGLI